MNELHLQSDEELVALTLQDEECFVHVMERYEAKLLRYVRRLTGVSGDAAEDVIQNTFIKVYRSLNSFDPALKFSSWIYRIAHNEAVNYVKKHRRVQVVALETDDDAADLIDVLESDVNVVDEVARQELVEKVRTVMNGLSEKYRQVLVLRFLEDKDYAEIGDILKKSVGTVSTLINRAKAQFKTLAEKNNLNLLLSDHE